MSGRHLSMGKGMGLEEKDHIMDVKMLGEGGGVSRASAKRVWEGVREHQGEREMEDTRWGGKGLCSLHTGT